MSSPQEILDRLFAHQRENRALEFAPPSAASPARAPVASPTAIPLRPNPAIARPPTNSNGPASSAKAVEAPPVAPDDLGDLMEKFLELFDSERLRLLFDVRSKAETRLVADLNKGVLSAAECLALKREVQREIDAILARLAHQSDARNDDAQSARKKGKWESTQALKPPERDWGQDISPQVRELIRRKLYGLQKKMREAAARGEPPESVLPPRPATSPRNRQADQRFVGQFLTVVAFSVFDPGKLDDKSPFAAIQKIHHRAALWVYAKAIEALPCARNAAANDELTGHEHRAMKRPFFNLTMSSSFRFTKTRGKTTMP